MKPPFKSTSLVESNILFYDGVCTFCNGAVNFVIDRDPKGKISFASLQSDFAKDVLPDHTEKEGDPDTMVFVEDGILYERSTAALRVARHFGRPWNWIARILLLLPVLLRDGVYNWIARNRYAWFGREESCRIPTPDLKARFLD